MSTTFSSPITPDGERRQILRLIQACHSIVITIKEASLKNAIESLKKSTHRSPLLGYFGAAGIRELEYGLEGPLDEEMQGGIHEWLRNCLDDIKAYKKATEELAEAEARVGFYKFRIQKAQELFLYTIIYDKQKHKANECGQAFPHDYASWIHTQPVIDFGSVSQEEWLKKKKAKRLREAKADISEEQYCLVREVEKALRGKRLADNGEKELLGL